MIDHTAAIEKLARDGFAVIPDALPPEQVSELRAGLEDVFSRPDEETELRGGSMTHIWRPRMFEHGPAFEAVVDNPRIIDLVEAVLGGDCHLIANSALRTGPGEGISGWHADETVRYPIPPGVEVDPRIPLPPTNLNLNYYLCDVDLPLGPTEFVPGSHRAGRQPGPDDFDPDGNPHYRGQGVFSAVGRAGTAVIWNDQTWHHGAKNRSADGTRWVLQAPYARRWISQRFWPFVNYRLPEGVIERANP
ncbi:MAG: phytanoyl-CoA dioxygenase family protein, partial [Armatimonadetes bacterium]|nr:phytanoyl-CoA dioxygenase family protein [Armatimonadota bacterium]